MNEIKQGLIETLIRNLEKLARQWKSQCGRIY